MRTLVFLLEEPSAKDLLEGLLPALLPLDEITVRYLVFEGKRDLESKMVRRLRSWRAPDSRFVVLRDQDAGDCRLVKTRLQDLADQGGRPNALVRVACRELESWILGDWAAVAQAFDRPNLHRQKDKARYRNPDELSNPVHELRKFIPDYRKRDGARRLGKLLRPGRNASRSFEVFCRGVQQLCGAEAYRPGST